MGIISLKCPECGGELNFDDKLEKGFCQYCGSKIAIKEEIVKNVSITHNEIKDSNVTIINDAKRDFEIKAGILIKYNGEADVVKIPDNVKTIGEKAFCGLAITEVTLPNSIKEIGSFAFKDCKSLKKITIPKSVKIIGDSAFGRL